MKEKIIRNYLEIKSLNQLNDSDRPSNLYSIKIVEPKDFQLNKFFYKNIGKTHNWVDRLVWTENQWINYVNDLNVKTHVLKKENDLAGYFELIFHRDKNETEIAYLGLLDEYKNKRLGSYLLSTAIKIAFNNESSRVWVHTCSLDHKNALKNYISRGMRVFKKETINI